MSFRLQSMVWPYRGAEGTAKLVLARLADLADDDGGSIFPSVQRVADDCGISERTTQDALRKLEACGVLSVVREADPAAKRPREYRINVRVLSSDEGDGVRNLHPSKGDGEGCEICTGAKSARVQKTTERGAKSAPNPTIEPTKADAAARASVAQVGMQVLRLVGVADDPTWFGNYARVGQWLANGADPESDIYPTIQRVMARRGSQGPPRGLEYFDRAVADAIATRNRPMPEGQPNDQRGSVRPSQRQPSGGRFQQLLERQLASGS